MADTSPSEPLLGQLLKPITEKLSVAPQVPLAHVAGARSLGYHHLICNRPDDEEPGQPSIDQMQEAAADAELAFTAIPIGRGGLTEEDIQSAAEILQSGQRILAYCRSGTRSAILFSVARARLGDAPETIIADAANAGYDLTPYRSLLSSSAP